MKAQNLVDQVIVFFKFWHDLIKTKSRADPDYQNISRLEVATQCIKVQFFSNTQFIHKRVVFRWTKNSKFRS